jgi:hypothetical protein
MSPDIYWLNLALVGIGLSAFGWLVLWIIGLTASAGRPPRSDRARSADSPVPLALACGVDWPMTVDR